MKKSDLVFASILVPADCSALLAAAVAAYFVRFAGPFTEIRPVTLNIPFGQFFLFSAIAIVVWIGIFAVSGLYAPDRRLTPAQELSRIFLACSTGALGVIVFFFFSRNLFASRFVILAAWALSIVAVVIERGLVRLVFRLLYRNGIGVHRILLIGTGEVIRQLEHDISRNPSWGLKIVGVMHELTEETLGEIEERMRSSRIDELIIMQGDTDQDLLARLMDIAIEHQVVYKYFPGALDTYARRLAVQTLSGFPVIEIRQTALDGWGRIFKRLFDICFSFLGLLVVVPLGAIIGVFIRLDTQGPVLLGLSRVGVRGKVFVLWKFRSMIRDAQLLKKELLPQNERVEGPLFKLKNDPRITRVGKFLRRTSIDELPQLWNVLIGDMSLVGPRPHEPQEVAKYKTHQKQLLNIKPGITGMAQISGRSALTFEEEARLDVYYIQNWSLVMDIVILFRTVGVVLLQRNAE